MMEKINGFLKTDGRRELDLEEMEKVAGGSFSYQPGADTCTVNGSTVTCEQFDKMIFSIAETSGWQIAAKMLIAMTGYTCPEMAPSFKWEKDTGNKDRIDMVMESFWRDYDGKK